jgi:hypothetical protein
MQSPFRRLLVVSACALAAATASAQQLPQWLTRFSVHGYVSQAYAVSEDHQIFGIPTEGTADYRDLALQFRYDPNRKNAVVLQLRQQRFGESRKDSDEVELDWAFYQRTVSDRFSLKAGRIPLPLGIYNEAGGAAMTSPFFRPPHEFYDRQYTSKTLDGGLASLSLGKPQGWSFDVDGYFGRWALDQWNRSDQIDAKNAWGAQVWANTPIQGVRFGAGAYRCDVDAPAGVTVDYVMVHASVDADLDRWRLSTEYLSGNLDYYGRYRAAYAQAGYQFTPKFSVHARKSVARLDIPVNGHSVDAPLSDGVGVSLNYAIHPALMFKIEGHRNDGLLREDVPRNLYGTTSETRYWIASVVASF